MKTKEQLEEALILATSNPYNAEDILDDSDAVRNIVNEFVEEWEDAECDEEDATPEQKEALDAILDKYTNLIYELINKPHSVSFDYHNNKLSWYDANGEQFLCEVRPYVWWDVDILNVLNNMYKDAKIIADLEQEIEDTLPFELPKSNDCYLLIKDILEGKKSVDELVAFCEVLHEEVLTNLIDKAKANNADAQDVLEEIFETIRA